MKKMPKFYKTFYTGLALLAGAIAVAAAVLLTFHQENFQKVDQFLIENNFQGAVLIAKEGKVLFSKGYGLADEEHFIPNTSQTVFRLGSVTKQFTAAAILLLQEKGLLHVHDPIIYYLPDYPHGDQITIHHLLSHTSGIPSITDFANLPEIQRHPSTPRQVMGYFQHLPLEFSPGTDCKYSNSGYIVLGAIIEAVAATSYENYILKNFFIPLGMDSTYYAHNNTIIPRRAIGYEIKSIGEKRHANYLDMSFPHAAGALASTVEDLYKWDRALKEGAILSKASLDSLFMIHGVSRKNQISYGYGFFIGSHNQELEKGRNTLIGHYGTIEGFRAASFRDQDDDLTIIILSNVENTAINALHLEIAQIIRRSWRPCAAS